MRRNIFARERRPLTSGLQQAAFVCANVWQPKLLGPTTAVGGFTFACASTRTAQTGPNTLAIGIAANQPYVAHNPFLNGAIGLQHEPAATQTLTYATAPSTANWNINTGFGASLVAGQTDPSGGALGATLTGPSNNFGGYLLTAGAVSIDPPCTASLWINASAHASVSVGNVVATVLDLPAGNGGAWQRYSLTTTTSFATTALVISETRAANNPTGTASTLATLAYLQLEAGGIPTSAIPNAGTGNVTRVASTVSATVSSWSNFKLRLDFYPFALASYPANITLFEASTAANFSVYIAQATGYFTIVRNGVTVYVDAAYAYSFTPGDLWSWQLTWTSGACSVNVYKNDIFQRNHVFSSAAPTASASVYFGSKADGTLHTFGNATYFGVT